MEVKIVLVGDRGVGKATLVERYMGTGAGAHGVLNVSRAHINYKGSLVNLSVWTFNAEVGSAKCTKAEAMSHALMVKDTFSGASCILHCIDLSLGKPALATVQRRIIKSMVDPRVPYLLVGCKADVRCQALKGENFGFDEETLQRVASKLGMQHSRSCSATTGEGVKELFDVSVKYGSEYANGRDDTGVTLLGEEDDESSDGSWDSGDEEEYLAEQKRKMDLQELKPDLEEALVGIPEEMVMVKEILEKIKGYVEEQ